VHFECIFPCGAFEFRVVAPQSPTIRPCVDWRVMQWARKNGNKPLEVTKEFRGWVTGFAVEKVDYMEFTLEIQGVIEGVVRGFRRAVLEKQARFYKPWTPRNSKWAG